jgi:hypothetical protein
VNLFEALQQQANDAIRERRDLEALEAGRRQKEGFEYPERE